MCGPPDAGITINRDSPGPDAPDADVTAPLVASTSPANNATGVSRTTTITVTFDEAVFNVDTSSFTVMIGAGTVAGSITPLSALSYEFTPSSMLAPSATVMLSLSAVITDFVGNALAPVSFSFETGT